eukprot:1095288-Rhodomonas_salina.1
MSGTDVGYAAPRRVLAAVRGLPRVLPRGRRDRARARRGAARGGGVGSHAARGRHVRGSARAGARDPGGRVHVRRVSGAGGGGRTGVHAAQLHAALPQPPLPPHRAPLRHRRRAPQHSRPGAQAGGEGRGPAP